MGDFTGVTPTLVTPESPAFHTIVTETESQKKQFLNLSGSTPVYQYRLQWKNMTDTEYGYLLNHFIGVQGGGVKFTWKSVPDYVDTTHDGTADGGNMEGRWVIGSFSSNTNPYSHDAEITFEEDI